MAPLQYPQGGSGGSILPPPPPPNFPPTPDAYYDTLASQQPPHPPHPPHLPHPAGPTHQHPSPPPPGVAYDENFEPISATTSMSVSPSQASLSSHYSSESARSLSPPVGPARGSPAQNRLQLGALQEEGGGISGSLDLQAALVSKLRQRSSSFDMNDPTNGGGMPPALPRTTSVGSRAYGGPRVAHKPPRGPNKPSRSSSLRVSPSAAGGGGLHNNMPYLQHYQNQNHAPPPPTSYNNGTGAPPAVAPPHHVIQPNRHSACSSDSDGEDESAFAKALKQKRLRKTNSGPNLA